MQGISGIVYLILAACLLPYVFTMIAKLAGGFKSKDNQNPRAFWPVQQAWLHVPMRRNKTVLKVCLYFWLLY